MDFLSSGLFWLFFALVAILMFVMEVGVRFVKTSFVAIGGWGGFAIVILAFVFMWWQGGVAILVSTLIWMIIAMLTVNRLLR